MTDIIDPTFLILEYISVAKSRFKNDPVFREFEADRIRKLEGVKSNDPADWADFADCVATGIGSHGDETILMHIDDMIDAISRGRIQQNRQMIANIAYLLTKLDDESKKIARLQYLTAMIASASTRR